MTEKRTIVTIKPFLFEEGHGFKCEQLTCAETLQYIERNQTFFFGDGKYINWFYNAKKAAWFICEPYNIKKRLKS